MRLKSHPLVQQISGMMALTAVGQGLYLLAGPFIGRLYSPEQIGIFGLFVTAWTFMALFACGLFDMAIPSARNDEEARRLSAVSIVIGVIVAFACGALVASAATQDWLGFGILPVWAGAMMAAGMLTQMFVLIGQGWAIRGDQVLRIGYANVLMNGARSVLQVAGGLLSPVWAVMLAGEIAARLMQARSLRPAASTGTSPQLGWNDLRKTISENRRFPIVFGPAFILDAIAMLIQTTTIGSLYGAAAMGQYFLMRRTLDMPVAFAFKSLSDLFFVRQITLAREAPQRLRPFFLRSGIGIAIVGTVASLPLLFFGPELFRLFFGPNWGQAGYLAMIFVPAMVANLAVAPVARVFQLSEKSYLRLIPGLVSVCGSTLILWAAQALSLTIIGTTTAISFTIIITYLVYFVVGYFVAGHISLTTEDQPIISRP